MAYYQKPKHSFHFNPIDFVTKEETENQISITDVMQPPIIDEGITFIKSDLKLHTNPNFIFDDETSRLGIGTNAPSTTLHVQGNSTLTGDVNVTAMLTSANLTVGNVANLKQASLKSSTFNSLNPIGLVGSCSVTSEYPVVIQAIDDTLNLVKSAIAFSSNTDTVSSILEADLTYSGRLLSTPARGKLDMNFITGVSRENVASFQYDRINLKKNTGINYLSPVTMLHVGGDIIGSNIGIGLSTAPTYKLTFPSTSESKICLYAGSSPTTSFYGLGISSSALNYQVDSTGSAHVFRSAGKNNDGNVLMSINGVGKVGIGTTSQTLGKLTFANIANEKKITFNSTDAVTHTGIDTRLVYSTNRETLEYHLQDAEAEHQFYATSKPANTLRHLMKVHWSSQDSRPCVYIGTGQGRSYQFECEQDSCAKPGFSGYWTVSSDERIKENIIDADLDRCYEIVKNVKLKRFRFKDGIYNVDEQLNGDAHGLGFIAQDVKKYFNKSCVPKQLHGLDDCLTLNQDQILKALYGTVQKLMEITEQQQQTINNLQTEMSELKKLVF